MNDEPKQPLPCIVCQTELQAVDPAEDNHASDANAFTSHGQYGSTVFDAMDETFLEINVCDECIIHAGKMGRVYLGRSVPRRRFLKPWSNER